MSCLPWLQIANEPPPLREIPPDCSPLVTEVLKAGLQKEPIRRASVPDLRVKAMRALQSGKPEVSANGQVNRDGLGDHRGCEIIHMSQIKKGIWLVTTCWTEELHLNMLESDLEWLER